MTGGSFGGRFKCCPGSGGLFITCWLNLSYSLGYHRLTHEVDFLWSIHATHHRSKRPSPILAILADSRQECLEIALIPFATTLIVPMSFHELYLTMIYVVSIELIGHSGVRAYWTTPVLGPILRPLNLEGCIEDHDQHHGGGKSGKN